MISKSIIYKILKEYEDLRDFSHTELSKRKVEVYKLIPRIEEIDQEISETSINLSKEILKDPTKTKEISEKLQKRNMDLKIEKGELLASNNFPTDYLTPKYKCESCKDTGYVDNEKCKCFKQKLINYAYKESNLSNLLEYQNFDNFDFKYYSDTINIDKGKSPKENIQTIYKTCLDFVNSFDASNENIIFTGPTGLGKTFLSSCIAKDLLDAGHTVFYQTAFKIFDVLEEYKFSKNKNDFDKEKINILFDVDLLIIDDLGTEFVNSYTSSEFFNILNSRLLNNKKTLISTNLSLNELFDTYSARVASRIWGNYKVMEFFGDDIRQKNSVNFN